MIYSNEKSLSVAENELLNEISKNEPNGNFP